GRGNLLAVAALAVEDSAGARDELARAAALAPPDSASARSPQAGLRALLDAVEDAPEASRTCTELAATSTLDTIARSFGELAAAVLAGRRGDAGPAGAAVAAAVEADLARTPWHQAMGRRLVAEAAVADGWGEPARWAREALEFFEAADVAEPARASRSLLRRAGGTVPQRPSGLPDELARLGITPREADVLTLLATGLANREIATRLYVSVRTVEKHVERIMVKTSTRRRSQLAARYG
ncbi:MAG TPA: LuxR C-terminal-related transcriptional regulator, partial [Actinomycetospora sp.]|nr:LuxR C-terminal-related transcriptional regulator [Actinomycetospora sp.]